MSNCLIKVLCKATRSFARVEHDQDKKGCAGCKPDLNTSAGHRCSISFQNIARLGKGLEERHQQVPHEGNSQPGLLRLTLMELVPDGEGWTVLSMD